MSMDLAKKTYSTTPDYFIAGTTVGIVTAAKEADGAVAAHNLVLLDGGKVNFDTGLYTAHTILYIRVEDYGPKPKIGKQLVLDKGTKSQRTYTINLCQEESGVYRMTMERTRQ